MNNDKGKIQDVYMFVVFDIKVYINYYWKCDSIVWKFWLEYFENGELVLLFKANIVEWVGLLN